jgi:GT2 family glycosyltransferase
MTDDNKLADGCIDGVDDAGWIFGWASSAQQGVLVNLRVSIDGEIAGEIVADQFRGDLAASGLPNSNCAFWYSVPTKYHDGLQHHVVIADRNSGEQLRNTPFQFKIADELVPAPVGQSINLIPNAQYTQWPDGITIKIVDRFQQVCTGWYFDYKIGHQPEAVCSVQRPDNLSLVDHGYALDLSIQECNEGGYYRLIVPLEATALEVANSQFSVGIRRPPYAASSALHVQEIFIGALLKRAVRKVGSIRKKIAPRGTQRIINVPISSSSIDNLRENESLCIVFEFSGTGSVLLFNPELRRLPLLKSYPESVIGEFEDKCIQEQVAALNLSSIWRARVPAVASRVGQEATPAVRVRSEQTIEGLPFIQVVIPVFNASIYVEELIRSLIEHTSSPFEVLIFDDGSDEFGQERTRRLQEFDSRVRYFRHDRNIGYTRNINIALQSTVADFVVLINSDTVVTANWLKKMYSALVSDDKTAAVGPVSNAASWQSVPRTKASNGEWMVNAFPSEITPNDVARLVDQNSLAMWPEFPLLNGFCTLFRREALEQVGYFDDQTFPEGYGEENDLCLRLASLGWNLKVCDDAYVHHKKSKSFGQVRRKELSKKGNLLMRSKHPEVDIVAIEDRMRASYPVNELRSRLALALQLEKMAK